VYLNASGIDPRQHPVKNELDRVKGYMTKLKEAVAKGNEEKNPLKLDKAAANRFIKAGLVDADGA
jgi:exosome complex protein LRP1